MAFPTVRWLDSFEIGVPEIDAEHRAIVDLLAGIVARLGAGALDQVPAACDALRATAVRHWANEERRLEAAGFPQLAEHREVHRRLDATTRALPERCGRKCRTDLAENCVGVWFTAILDHIVRHDTAFSAFLQRR